MSRGTALAVGGLTLLGTALTVNGIRKFATFDDAMNQSLAIMGDVSTTMREDMADGARRMARETIFSAEQAAESYFFLASAGLNAEQSIAALPQVAKFAQAGMFDMARATDLLTDAQSALGLTSENTQENMRNMARVSDVLVKANTLANATVEQFSSALTNRAAPRLRVLNKEIEEGAAVLAVFADQGIKGNRAGTTLDQTFRELTRRANENKEAFADMNIEVFEAGEMRNIADIIEDMENALGGMTVQARQAELAQLGFTQRSLRGILALQGTSEQLREYERELRKAQGTTDEVANKQLNSLIKQLGLLGSEFTDLFIEIGKGAAPAVETFVRAMREGIRDTRFALKELDRDFGDFLDNAGPFGLAEPFLEHGVVGTVQIALDPSLLIDAEKFAQSMEKQLELAEDFNAEINKAPRAFREMLRGAELTGSNLEDFRIIVDNLDERAAPFVRSLGEAAQVMRLMNEHGLSLEQALKSIGVTTEEITKGGRDEAPAGLLPEDVEERAAFIEELTQRSKDQLTLTEARREAEEDMLGIQGQLRGTLNDVNAALAERVLLSEAEEASLLRQRTALQEMLTSLSPINTEIASIRKDMELMESTARAQQGLAGMNVLTYSDMSNVQFRILKLLMNQKNLTQQQVNDLKEMLTLWKQIKNESVQTQVGAQQPVGGVEPLPVPRLPIDDADHIKKVHEQANRVAEAAGEGTIDPEVWGPFFDDVQQIGENLIHSLITGTFDAKDFLAQSISRLVTGFIFGPLTSLFSFGSPSKVMINYGRDITVGLAQGIEAEGARVGSAWQNVMGRVNTPPMLPGGMRALQGAPMTQAMQQQIANLSPEFKVRVDTSGMPAPQTPFEITRDAKWQKMLRESITIARQDGFE